MKRRDALKTLGAMAGSAYASKFLSACDNPNGPGSIDTVVFLMMENRSYDHYFGCRNLLEGLPGEGLRASMSNPNGQGDRVSIFPATDNHMCLANDPPHGWDATRMQFGAGANDGFVRAHEERFGAGATEPMMYLTREQLPVSHALADAYTVCDHWFSSILGPTMPNRMYWHAGTSKALATSPQWERCLLIITYDEHGGFFDHVSPPKVVDERSALGFDQLGFRVPTVVIGPYVKQNYVSSVQYEHTSTIKHLANWLGLPPLTARSDGATDLVDCLDLERLAANAPAPPIVLPGVEIDEASLPDSCRGESLRTVRYDHDLLRWADADSKLFGPWDRRTKTREDVYEIAAYLDRHNLGRIRRSR